MQFEGILTVLRHRDQYVLKSSKGMDELSMLRSGCCSCITRDSRNPFFSLKPYTLAEIAIF